MDEIAQEQPPVEEPADAVAKPGMTPEAKAAAQKLLAASMRIVYKKEVTDSILNSMQKAKSPEMGIAQNTVMVLKNLAAASKGVPPEVIASMSRPVVMMVAEIAEKAGIVEDAGAAAQGAMSIVQRIMEAAKGQAQQQGQPQQPPAQPAAQPQPGIIAGQMGAA